MTLPAIFMPALQYPQTGRTSCNLFTNLSPAIAIMLAVPSDGSNLMQPTIARSNPGYNPVLQYPQTGRTSCNCLEIWRCQVGLDLQYPQTGRTSCNTGFVRGERRG